MGLFNLTHLSSSTVLVEFIIRWRFSFQIFCFCFYGFSIQYIFKPVETKTPKVNLKFLYVRIMLNYLGFFFLAFCVHTGHWLKKWKKHAICILIFIINV